MNSKCFLVFIMYLACCYCLENNNEILVEETRAKKRTRRLRLLGALLLFIVSKVAIAKVFTAVFFWMLFQKLMALTTLAIEYWMKNKKTPTAPAVEANDYNTIGYSYNPPETLANLEVVTTEANLGTYGVPHNWPYNRRVSGRDLKETVEKLRRRRR